MIEATPDHSVGHRFLRAIAERDWESLERLSAAGQVSVWFKDADVHEVLESDVEVIADRLRVRYRVRNHEPEGWFLAEQQAYLTTGPKGIEACNLICSGFLPIAAPDGTTSFSIPR